MSEASYRLVVRSGPNPGMIFDLTKEVTLIGRDVTNDIVIGDAEVSRQHARVTRTPGGFVLEDLGSTNGTFVGGERLVAPRVLNPGEGIGLGENVNMVYESTDPEAAATVMSAAAEKPATVLSAQPDPAAAAPQMAQPVSPSPVATPSSKPSALDNKPWLLAGAGCAFLLLACIITLFLMDAFAPDILYAPLRLFGF
jgi:pSer/pThr/pTyr-binding forkhead associated (FHA) protein